jgi:hypothetical protein
MFWHQLQLRDRKVSGVGKEKKIGRRITRYPCQHRTVCTIGDNPAYFSALAFQLILFVARATEKIRNREVVAVALEGKVAAGWAVLIGPQPQLAHNPYFWLWLE